MNSRIPTPSINLVNIVPCNDINMHSQCVIYKCNMRIQEVDRITELFDLSQCTIIVCRYNNNSEFYILCDPLYMHCSGMDITDEYSR